MLSSRQVFVFNPKDLHLHNHPCFNPPRKLCASLAPTAKRAERKASVNDALGQHAEHGARGTWLDGWRREWRVGMLEGERFGDAESAGSFVFDLF